MASSAVAYASRLRITEIFLSLQGESTLAGWPTVFVRLTGCPLRCGYCDTSYAFRGGRLLAVDEIVGTVSTYGVSHVCVTGGEPLAQKPCLQLLQSLCDGGFKVSLETSGALDISQVDARVIRVVDLKTPGSGEADRNRWENIDQLTPRDEIKFVLCDRADYEWARQVMDRYALAGRCTVLLSPVHGQLDPTTLAEWIVADRLSARLQVQLHKLLWGNQPGR